MQTGVPLSQLPASLKIALGLFVLHIGLYVLAMVDVFMAGGAMQPTWFFHLFVSSYLATRIPRRGKGLLGSLLLYIAVLPSLMLWYDYAAKQGSADPLSEMTRTILVCLPLYLAAPFLIAGRPFYLSQPRDDAT